MSLADIAAGVSTADTKVETGTSKAAGDGLKNLTNLPGEALEALRAPQRAFSGFGQYVEDNNLADGSIFKHPDKLGAALQQGKKWAMDPKRDDAADRYDRRRMSTEDGGFIPSDKQINAHLSGLPATAARWGAQTASSVLGDPTSFIPAGAIGKAAKLLPGVGRVGEALSKSGIGRAASAAFNAEHHLGGLTEHGQNVVEGVRNRITQAGEREKVGEDLVISRARKDLKAGNIPQPVADLVQKYKLAPLTGPKKPSELLHEIGQARKANEAEQIKNELRSHDLLEGGPQSQMGLFGGAAPKHAASDLFKDVSKASEARAGVAEHIKPSSADANVWTRGVSKGNNMLKGMFLAVPLPHVANLVNLSYNKYGMATTLRGLMYAAQESTGLRRVHFTKLVAELQEAGADNQYGKIFSEVNDFGGGSIRQVQRLANRAQDKVLNPVERGLRASMLETEKGAGRVGDDAARGIHKALGTDAATGTTNFLSHYVPLSQFPRFHTQTAMGSTLRTLRDKPGRITGFEHAFGGPDQRKDGQAHYHLSTPTASGMKMLTDPVSYLTSASTLGGLAGIASPYSGAGLLKKARTEDKKGQHRLADRDYQKAASAFGSKLLPLSGSVAAINEIAHKKRGDMRESGLQDLASSLGGGYWSKQ